jgi:dynein heavy chain 2
VQQSNSLRITSQLKTMATAEVSKGGWDKERMAQQLQPLLQLWNTLVSGSPVLKAPKLNAKATTSPVDSFVAMEAEFAHGLVNSVNKLLDAVSRVLRGSELLTASVRDAAVNLAAGLVPAAWSDQWEGPESPGLWLQAVVSKTGAINAWLESVHRGATLSSTLSLNDMFSPAVFLNALRQQVCMPTCGRSRHRPSHALICDFEL